MEQLEAKERDLEAAAQKSSRAIAERDAQLEQLADSLSSVSERLKSTQNAGVAEKSKLKEQVWIIMRVSLFMMVLIHHLSDLIPIDVKGKRSSSV